MTTFYRWDTKAQMVSWRKRQGAATRTAHKRLSSLGAKRTSKDAQTAARAGRKPGSHARSLALCSAGPATRVVSRPARIPAAQTRSSREARVPGRLTLGGRSQSAASSLPVPVRPSASTAGLQAPRNHSDNAPSAAHRRLPSPSLPSGGVAATRLRTGARQPGVSSARVSWKREREPVAALCLVAEAPRAPGSRLRPLAKSAER